jgi:hypothetical protein
MPSSSNWLSQQWWIPEEAITFLRGATEVDCRPLPTARHETKALNAAIQAGHIDVITVMVDGTRRELQIEDKALLAVRFHEDWFVGSSESPGGIGVVLDIIDTDSGKRSRNIQKLLLRAEHVRELRVSTGAPLIRTTAINPFATGSAGRPTARDLIRAEFRRRIETGQIRSGFRLSACAEMLTTWWETERKGFDPPGPPTKQGTIENIIREPWRALGSSSAVQADRDDPHETPTKL